MIGGEIPRRNPDPSKPCVPLPPASQAEIDDATRAILQAVDAEIGEHVAKLASADDAHLLGANEFGMPALAHKFAVEAIEPHLGQKRHPLGELRGPPARERARHPGRVGAEPLDNVDVPMTRAGTHILQSGTLGVRGLIDGL